MYNALPDAWADLHASDLRDDAGQPFRTLLRPMWYNRSFTDVSFRDVHLDAKVCVFNTAGARGAIEVLWTVRLPGLSSGEHASGPSMVFLWTT